MLFKDASEPAVTEGQNGSTPQANSRDAAARLAADDVVISVRQVSKAYLLYDHPQDRLKDMIFRRFGRTYGREFWALRDISFQARRGEAVGIIGRNGSGKSTLLQILAGILRPTTGEVETRGRVAALLELGSGFNLEYTGRENVFLNGAILGMPREAMERRFDEIAAFADIGEFIDQPVKTYSSGMFVRLAFAVTTNLDADILLIDEALAVGDVFFRQKCYKRLETLRNKGVSIVLVSHAMLDVEQFCQRALLLHRGEVAFLGKAAEAVRHYYLIEQEERARALTARRPPSPPPASATAPNNAGNGFWPEGNALLDISGVPQISNGWARCTAVAVCNQHDQPCRVFQQGETAIFFYEFELLQDIEVPIGGLVIQNDKGVIVHGKSTLEFGSEVPLQAVRGSRLRFRQEIALELAVGEYTFEVGLATMTQSDYERRRLYSHPELHGLIIRLCHLSDVDRLAVAFRRNGVPVQLLHHGVANLPGSCRVMVESFAGNRETWETRNT